MSFTDIRFKIRSFFGRDRHRFILYAMFCPRKRNLLITKRTDICIEGYPRCANTFAVLAFESEQQQVPHIAHHIHLAGQVLQAVKHNIPVILLIRDPIEACTSLYMREPKISMRCCLELYLDFYQAIIPVLDQIVVASFQDITSRYDQIILQVNEKYGSHFCLYTNSTEMDESIFERIVKLPQKENDLSVSRPTESKEGKKELIHALIQQKQYIVLLDECKFVYERIINH